MFPDIQLDAAAIAAVHKAVFDESVLLKSTFDNLQRILFPTASASQLDDNHLNYMAGAQLMYVTLMRIFDPEVEPKEADATTMTNLCKELEQFNVAFAARFPNLSEVSDEAHPRG